MRFVVGLLALVPAVLCQLEPEDSPKPTVKGFSTIKGTCDPSSGIISGASFSGQQGTLKACSKACADNANCKGLNFITDQNQCQLFRQECDSTQRPKPTDPTQNFYLKGEISCSRSTVGNEFYLAFMANRVAQPQNKSLEIWLTQDKEAAGTTVVLETDPSAGLTRNITVPYKTAVSTLIPFTWKLSDVDNGVTIEKKALRLSSDVDFVFYGVNKEYFTADAFLGVPSRALGTRYVANCHWPPFYNCEFAITATADDTTVRVTLPRQPTRNLGNWAKPPTGIPNTCKIPFRGRDYTNGDSFEFKLNVFEAAQIQDPCDLTGAIIVADKPIAVWSGDSRVNVGDSPSRDHQVEQLFSTDAWGTDCAAWPTPNRAPGLTDYWVITAAEDGTEVKVESNEKETVTYNLNAAQSVRFPAGSVDEWQRFTSTKKFQAVQYAHSAVDNSIPGDPSSTVCIPSDQFGFGYTFVTPTGVSSPYTNFLTIITTKNAVNGFILDGQPITVSEWKDVPNSNLVGGVVRLNPQKTQFRIEHRVKGTTFEAYIYGSGDRESIAYPTGACIKALGECTTTTMVVGDGLDNDCDGVIDEELFDGIDNDLDGKIDEDCYARKPQPKVQDRCPQVFTAQACYNGKLQLQCETGNIKVIEAHFGRLSRAGELTCGSENVLEACSGSDADCGFADVSKFVRTVCDGQQSCASPVNYFSLGNLYAPSNCPTCSLYAHVQYVCLNAKEEQHGALTGSNYQASSWFGSTGATAAAGTCSADSCPAVAGNSKDPHHPRNADFSASSSRGWRPATCDQDNSWLQIDLGGQFAVGWYAISGCRKTDQWVKTFGISYSQDGVTWKDVRDASGALKVYTANSDAIGVKVCTLFTDSITARWIRILPLSYNGAPCAHVDFGHNSTLQGCSQQAVANSNFENGNTAAFGTEATVKCNKGWATQAGATSYKVACGSDGQWAAQFRPCNRLLTCGDIPQIEGGYSVAANNQVGAVVKFACLGSRRLNGANSITCGEDGKWSAAAPTCEQL